MPFREGVFGIANRNDLPTPKGYKSYAKVKKDKESAVEQAGEGEAEQEGAAAEGEAAGREPAGKEEEVQEEEGEKENEEEMENKEDDGAIMEGMKKNNIGQLKKTTPVNKKTFT